jgi:transcriptional regulator with XRE-family HTH domain
MRGSELREARKRLGMTQGEMAAALGITKDYVGLMERGKAPIAQRTRLALSALQPPPSDGDLVTTDPMERIVEAALRDAGVVYETDFGGGNPSGLDFRLSNGVEIEVKRFHSDRTGQQMKRADNVIVAQGEQAVRYLADLLRAAGRAH